MWRTQSATSPSVISRMVSMPSTRSHGSRVAREAAEGLRRLLAAVEAGEIDAETPQARRLVRRLEGAVAAWEDFERQGSNPGE